METIVENGVSKAELCAKEVDEVLKKYNCTLIAERQIIYGQVVYVPSVAEINQKQNGTNNH